MSTNGGKPFGIFLFPFLGLFGQEQKSLLSMIGPATERLDQLDRIRSVKSARLSFPKNSIEKMCSQVERSCASNEYLTRYTLGQLPTPSCYVTN